MSDPHDLAIRTGLPAEMLYLRDALPRDRWQGHAIPQMAAFWLQMHGGFRQASAAMAHVVAEHRAGVIDIRTYHDRLLPTLARFLQHLDGHHNIESGHYFPQFRQIEPRIAAGIDLLDRDHEAVHAHLEALAAGGNALHQAVRSDAPAGDHASRLNDALDAAAAPLIRHLDDEEDIVIPLITLHEVR
ncbi:MAG: hemerythrin domain-containing protein [Brevundimonas sp.]|nr:MAG: hemerythrin domain-containing protein [Brevundimonas sp.]